MKPSPRAIEPLLGFWLRLQVSAAPYHWLTVNIIFIDCRSNYLFNFFLHWQDEGSRASLKFFS